MRESDNRVKSVLRAGGVPVGTIVLEFATTGLARIAAEAGVDFLVFDMEHSAWSIETIRMLIATSRAAELEPVVRVPALEYHFVARALDAGARGIMAPMVETEEQARALVSFAKYPPEGRRGSAFGIAHDDYRDGDVAGKIRRANAEGLVIAMVETARGLENVERIAAVPGLDVIWIGHFDLTASLGIAAQFDHPRYQEALRRILEAGQRHGKPCGFMVASAEEGEAQLRLGFRMLMYWGDIWLYKRALGEGVRALREGAARAKP